MRRICLTLLAIILAPPVLAEENIYVADNHQWQLSCNDSGYVLKSVNPVSRVTGMGAATELVTGPEVLSLGKSCDALHTVYGKGSWCFANGGFAAEFAGHTIGFPRQELWCEPDPGADCLC